MPHAAIAAIGVSGWLGIGAGAAGGAAAVYGAKKQSSTAEKTGQ